MLLSHGSREAMRGKGACTIRPSHIAETDDISTNCSDIGRARNESRCALTGQGAATRKPLPRRTPGSLRDALFESCIG